MAIVLLPSGDQFLNVEGQCRGLNKLLPQVLTDIPFTYHCVCVWGDVLRMVKAANAHGSRNVAPRVATVLSGESPSCTHLYV